MRKAGNETRKESLAEVQGNLLEVVKRGDVAALTRSSLIC